MGSARASGVLRWLGCRLGDMFGADLRSLALFRMALAGLALLDLADRATNLTAHYTDQGVLPRSVLLQTQPVQWRISVNLIGGERPVQALLFTIGACAALGLLVGYRTRLMTFIVWLILTSVIHRNPLVANAADVLLRLLYFWSLFLPLGACWSIDRWRGGQRQVLSPRFVSVGTAGLFLQIACLYWFSALLKSGDMWRVDLTAVYYALSLDEFYKPLGGVLYQFPDAMKAITIATLGFEALGPFLLLSPVFTGPLRVLGVLGFMAMHLGFGLTVNIGIFPWVAGLSMVCFLPTWFWARASKVAEELDRLWPALREAGSRVHRVGAEAYLSSAQHASSLRARFSLPLRTAKVHLAGVPGPAAEEGGRVPATKAVRPGAPDSGRSGAAAGKSSSAREASSEHASVSGEPLRLRSPLMMNVLALCSLALVLGWNLTTVTSQRLPAPLGITAFYLNLDQRWAMFAPEPPKGNGFYVISGSLRDGTQLDLIGVTRGDYTMRPGVDWVKSRAAASDYRSDRWRKYMENLLQPQHAEQRRHFSGHLCREWNGRYQGEQQLQHFYIYFMHTVVEPDYRHLQTTPTPFLLLEHYCLQ